jgi:DNA-directed RNA polymerase subunit omega
LARITVEDCLKRVPNRFLIVNLAAKRVRQIREGSEYLVSSPKNEDIVVALRELAAGKVKLKISDALPEMQPDPVLEAVEEQAKASEADDAIDAQTADGAPKEVAASDSEGESEATDDDKDA